MWMVRRCVEDMSDVDHRVTCDRKGEASLMNRSFFDGRQYKRADVKNCGQRRKPRLVAVLRTIVSKDGIRKVAFQKLGRPAFPFVKENREFNECVAVKMADQ